jgi:hypothetical protein
VDHFIGLCIEAGALISISCIPCLNPSASQDIYKDLNLSEMYVNQFPQFIGLMSFVVLAAKGLFVLSCRENLPEIESSKAVR